MKIRTLLIAIACVGLTATSARAELKTKGEGKELKLDDAQFSGEHKARYEVFAKSCTKCHEMARPVSALLTGKTPISGETFDEKGIKTYVVKMMRKPNSGISRDDAKEVIDFLKHARSLAE